MAACLLSIYFTFAFQVYIRMCWHVSFLVWSFSHLGIFVFNLRILLHPGRPFRNYQRNLFISYLFVTISNVVFDTECSYRQKFRIYTGFANDTATADVDFIQKTVMP